MLLPEAEHFADLAVTVQAFELAELVSSGRRDRSGGSVPWR
jgi:hypothetical protein